MFTRRALGRLLAAAPFSWVAAAKSKLPEGYEILRSFDARDWARAFVAHVTAKPSIATDEETMIGWFANALMRGYDEHRPTTHYTAYYMCGCSASSNGPGPLPDYCPEHPVLRVIGNTLRDCPSLRAAVARGWCADKNRNKAMDCDLAEAIVQELTKLRI